MALRMIEKGDVVLKRQDYKTMVETLDKLAITNQSAVNQLSNANGASKQAPFREGFFQESEKDVKTEQIFINVLRDVIKRAK